MEFSWEQTINHLPLDDPIEDSVLILAYVCIDLIFIDKPGIKMNSDFLLPRMKLGV